MSENDYNSNTTRNECAQSPEKEKVLTEKLNSLYAELTEYQAMVQNLHDFKNKLRGYNPEVDDSCEKSTEPISFIDKMQGLLNNTRRANSDFASILKELLEIL